MQHRLMVRARPGDCGSGITPRMVERHCDRHRSPAAESGKVDAPIVDRGRGLALGARHLDDLEHKIVVEGDEWSPRLDRITRGNAAIGICGRHRDEKPRLVVVLKLVTNDPADHADLAELLHEVRALLAISREIDDKGNLARIKPAKRIPPTARARFRTEQEKRDRVCIALGLASVFGRLAIERFPDEPVRLETRVLRKLFRKSVVDLVILDARRPAVARLPLPRRIRRRSAPVN